MMPDNIHQNLRRGADSLPLFHCFIDQRLSFCVQLVRLFDDRLGPIEKIDQRLARRQRFLNLPKLCIAETGNVTNEVNEPVLQHSPPCCWLCRQAIIVAGSTGRCNTGVKSLCWGFKLQGLTWSFVELTSHFVQIDLRVHRQVGALRKVLSQQAVGVLVRPALPRALRIAKIDVDVGRRAWSKEDFRRLRTMAREKQGVTRIAKALKRSPGATNVMAAKHGVSLSTRGMKIKPPP